MKFLEKDLEEIIHTADRAELGDRGLCLSGKLFRQLRIGNYGIADLVSVSRTPRFALDANSKGALWITIYELKKEKIGISTFLQAIGYAKGIERYLQKRGFSFHVKIEIVLIGKTMDENSTFCYLADFMAELTDGYTFPLVCYTYDYDVNGISFTQQCDRRLKKEGF